MKQSPTYGVPRWSVNMSEEVGYRKGSVTPGAAIPWLCVSEFGAQYGLTTEGEVRLIYSMGG